MYFLAVHPNCIYIYISMKCIQPFYGFSFAQIVWQSVAFRSHSQCWSPSWFSSWEAKKKQQQQQQQLLHKCTSMDCVYYKILRLQNEAHQEIWPLHNLQPIIASFQSDYFRPMQIVRFKLANVRILATVFFVSFVAFLVWFSRAESKWQCWLLPFSERLYI